MSTDTPNSPRASRGWVMNNELRDAIAARVERNKKWMAGFGKESPIVVNDIRPMTELLERVLVALAAPAPAEVTDEMVQLACDVYRDHNEIDNYGHRGKMRAALEAVLPKASQEPHPKAREPLSQNEQWNRAGREPYKYHPQASHVSPDYRDGWNAALDAVAKYAAPQPPQAQSDSIPAQELPSAWEQAIHEWFNEMKVDGEPLSPGIKLYAANWIESRAKELAQRGGA